MARNKFLSLMLLYPISRVYGWVMAIRNMMFERGILKQEKFRVPVVVVGNISMGGSGKTPHTEYLVDTLKKDYQIGVLSRGYKRRTKGFVLATPNSHVDDIGDEPYQIFHKFKNEGVVVAVCEKRTDGIREMLRLFPDLSLIILDDAFQHRYVKPTVSVVLMEYNRPPYNDDLLPFGRLREPVSALNRADVVVVTKCPDDMKPMEARIIKTNLNLFPYQRLLFSSYTYQPIMPVFPESLNRSSWISLEQLTADDAILAVTGVANPRPFIRRLRRYLAKVRIKRYADHHHFTHSDMNGILHKFTNMSGRKKIIVTTEKDAVRLKNNPYFPPELRKLTYYLPIKVNFKEYNDKSLDEVVEQLLHNNNVLRN
ncbi:MAG: tetraacyldisaccharide 4'-kinase [Bacteroides sp.]|nr:tetraacyldisaccharide 4'-kinase [Bacteroides sp.]MCM1412782.1 tetraacyldisaccharide 4'-kinase [Bacteroides sp.]MCM1470924.1 tetraacyldisaccharide 4'-kinase [Bacteroides sp.]